jgi:ligand-binding SRPBCC domain-containing protein
LAGLAGVGSEITTSFRMIPGLPFRLRWIARIVEFEWNHHFADVQAKGPLRHFHHRHEFASEVREGKDGTVVRDVIDYDPGFGPLGRIADAVVFRTQLTRTFQHRQRVLASLLTG